MREGGLTVEVALAPRARRVCRYRPGLLCSCGQIPSFAVSSATTAETLGSAASVFVNALTGRIVR